MTTAYYTGWKVAILICRIATAKFEAAMPEHIFLDETVSWIHFHGKLQDSSVWRASTYLAHLNARSFLLPTVEAAMMREFAINEVKILLDTNHFKSQ